MGEWTVNSWSLQASMNTTAFPRDMMKDTSTKTMESINCHVLNGGTICVGVLVICNMYTVTLRLL